MAGDVNNITKNQTIAFTLPISCQICLGKVKQPLLCPNNHVFCSACLEIWLERNHQCPSCRTPIDDDHPCKQILGGLNTAQESEKDEFTRPELRKARFDALFKEYESEFSKLRAQTELARAENSVLRQFMKKSSGGKSPESSTTTSATTSTTTKSLNTEDINGLAILTKKLDEATKLYDKIKIDMDHLKKENAELKEQNVDLVRQNERLKAEVTSRSPYKYGRYTVATMQTKLDCYEKEVSQLNSALEKSDSIIEELQKEVDSYKRAALVKGFTQNGQVQKDRGSKLASGDSNVVGRETTGQNQTNGCKDVGFSGRGGDNLKEVSQTGGNSVRESILNSLLTEKDSSGGRLERSGCGVKAGEGHKSQCVKNEFNSLDRKMECHSVLVSNTDSQGIYKDAKRSEPYRKTLFLDDSDVPTDKKGTRSKKDFDKDLWNTPTNKKAGILVQKAMDSPSKSNKKVKFNLPAKEQTNEVSSSFDLEVPSPLTNSTGRQGGGSAQRRTFDDGIVERAMEKVTAREISFSIDSFMDTSPVVYTNSNLKLESVDKSLRNINGKAERGAEYSSKKINLLDESLESSSLDVPGGTGNLIGSSSDELNDTLSIQNDLDELNISATPELKDCLKLMHKAEKNVNNDVYSKYRLKKDFEEDFDFVRSRTPASSDSIISTSAPYETRYKNNLKFSSLPNLRSSSVMLPESQTDFYPVKLKQDEDLLNTSGIVFSHIQSLPHKSTIDNRNNVRNYHINEPIDYLSSTATSNNLIHPANPSSSVKTANCVKSNETPKSSLYNPSDFHTTYTKPLTSTEYFLSNQSNSSKYPISSKVPYSTLSNTSLAALNTKFSISNLYLPHSKPTSTITSLTSTTQYSSDYDTSNLLRRYSAVSKPSIDSAMVNYSIPNTSVAHPALNAQLSSGYLNGQLPSSSSLGIYVSNSNPPFSTSLPAQFSVSTKYASTAPYCSSTFSIPSNHQLPKTQTTPSLINLTYDKMPIRFNNTVSSSSLNDLSYLSNASLSSLSDCFQMEPKKRLFQDENDESYNLFSPTKVTKTSR